MRTAAFFPVEDLHGWVKANRSLLLSSLYTFLRDWGEKGTPLGVPFSSYKRWGKIVGGVMKVLELGDPTLPHEDAPQLSGDVRTEAMKALFELAYASKPDQWIEKKTLYEIVAQKPTWSERDRSKKSK